MFCCPVDIEKFRRAWRENPKAISIPLEEQGEKISISEARFEPLEIFFSEPPSESMNLIDAISTSVSRCSPDIQALLNVVCLDGKNTLFPGFVDRMKLEMRLRQMPYSVEAIPGRGDAAYRGARLFSKHYFNLNTDLMQNSSYLPYLTKEEYDEYGPGEGRRKLENFDLEF